MVVLLAVVVYLIPVGAAAVLQVRLGDERAETKATAETLDDLNNLQDTLDDADVAMRYYAILMFDDREYLDAFRAAAARIPEELAAVEEGVPSSLEEPMAEMAAATDRQLEELDGLASFSPEMASRPGVTATDESVANERTPDLLEQLLSSTDALAAVQDRSENLEAQLETRLTASRIEVDRLQSWLVWAMLASLAAGLAVLGFGAAGITSGIVRRVELLSENSQRFLRGEPLRRVGRSADEIGRLMDGMGVVGEMLDQRRREAVAATRAKDEFMSRLSHELRTPLTAMIGFGQLLEEDDLPEESRDCARHIVRAGHHLLSLINELLDISKIETGHLTVSLEPVALDEVMDETVALVAPMAADRSITLTSDYPAGTLVHADRQRLKQVLLNLLSNAIKYNRYAGSVELAATAQDRAVRIGVSDTGAGIPPASLERLFQPFERLDADKTEVEGSGIGLALTKRLVEAMGGTIGVESEVGEGTTFWVELDEAEPLPEAPESETGPAAEAAVPEAVPVPGPVGTAPASAADRAPAGAARGSVADRAPAGAVPAAARGAPAAAGTAVATAHGPGPPDDRPVVLYVEDSTVNIRVMESLFRGRSERLEVAMQGRLGVELARELQPRLVLVDINLPDLDGDEVLRMLKTDPATADVPVVILSAAGGEAGARELAHGAYAYLAKPPEMARLVEILDSVAAKA